MSYTAFFDKVIINPYLQITIGASYRLTRLQELTRGKAEVSTLDFSDSKASLVDHI